MSLPRSTLAAALFTSALALASACALAALASSCGGDDTAPIYLGVNDASPPRLGFPDDAGEQDGGERIGRHRAAHRERSLVFFGGFHDGDDETQNRRVERRREVRERTARSVDGEGVLHEVVRAEAQEIGVAREKIGHDG